MSKRQSYLVLLSGAVLWCSMLVLPALVAAWNGPSSFVSAELYKFFSPVCHQYETRSLYLFGYKLAVCARCFGIYSGFLIGVIAIPFLHRPKHDRTRMLWIMALTPMMADVLLDAAGIRDCTPMSRSITGLLFGMIAAWLLTPHIADGISELFTLTITHHGEYNELKT